MAESSLSMGYPEFCAEIGHFLGYSRTSGNWTAGQLAEIEAILNSGYRQFLTPPPLPGEQMSHEWSFIKPTTTLALVANDYDYTLPDDFGGIIGCFHWDTSNLWPAIEERTPQQILEMRQGSTTTGRPLYFAIRPRYSDGTSGQRFEAIFYPTPDAAYTLTYHYVALLLKLSASYPYPFGGMAHAETILESCLAIAEERMDDAKAVHAQKWIERLVASVNSDRRRAPEFMGYNGDRSSTSKSVRPSYYVTVNSVQY